MASMIMASSKPIIRVPTNSSTPKLPNLQISLPTITPNLKLQLSKLKSMTLAATSLSFAFAPPSLAFEKAALFDFNLTLPKQHKHTHADRGRDPPKITIAMASMIMASSKPIIRVPTNSLPSSTPKLPNLQISLPTITPNLKLQLSKLKSMTLAATSLSFAFAPPSLAFEKAALFDFNLTLPIIVVEFLFLMFALDKLYFTPLGTFMDNRDAEIRGKLNSVTNTSEEVKELEEQANAVLRAARAEIAVALNQMKKETQAEVEAKIAEGRKKVDAELQEALANLEKQKEETVKALDSQIAALSQDIVNKVLPVSR